MQSCNLIQSINTLEFPMDNGENSIIFKPIEGEQYPNFKVKLDKFFEDIVEEGLCIRPDSRGVIVTYRLLKHPRHITWVYHKWIPTEVWELVQSLNELRKP